jgi:hypothetical protein
MVAKQARYRAREPKMRQDLLHLRNLAAHGMIAEKVLIDPSLIENALATLDRWENERGAIPALEEWRSILARAKSDAQHDTRALIILAQILLDPSEEGMRRRSSSPFAGILSPEEREALFTSARDE